MENILSPIGLVLIGFGVALAALIYFNFVKKNLMGKLDEILSKHSQPVQNPVAEKPAAQFEQKIEAPKAEAPKQEVKVDPKPEPEEVEVSPELIAVITSAAFHALKRNVKVRKIRLFSPTDSAWAESGRVNIMASHTYGKQQ
jgi:hypothetical protein